MPELPEVETTCRGLSAQLDGQTLHDVTLHRTRIRRDIPASFAADVRGRAVTRITRHAKYILIHLDDGGVVIVHLGMSGRMAFVAHDALPGKHDHVVFRYGSKRQKTKWPQLFFNDARRFGIVDYTTADKLPDHPLLKMSGIDPFDAALTGNWLFGKLQNRKTPMKNILMDQGMIAGLGNIYVCEALFVSRIDPRRHGAEVTKREAGLLVKAIRAVLDSAIAAGGSTLRDYAQTDGQLGYFQKQFNVYGREGEPCPRCGNMVARIVQSGRSTFYCATCQA